MLTEIAVQLSKTWKRTSKRLWKGSSSKLIVQKVQQQELAQRCCGGLFDMFVHKTEVTCLGREKCHPIDTKPVTFFANKCQIPSRQRAVRRQPRIFEIKLQWIRCLKKSTQMKKMKWRSTRVEPLHTQVINFHSTENEHTNHS